MSDLSRSIPGDVALFAAREWTEVADESLINNSKTVIHMTRTTLLFLRRCFGHRECGLVLGASWVDFAYRKILEAHNLGNTPR